MANRVLEFLDSEGNPPKRKGKKVTPKESPPAVIDRSNAAYTQGRVAFAAGAAEDDNPYVGATGGNRSSWFSGYFDARTNKKLGPVFQRNGITFP